MTRYRLGKVLFFLGLVWFGLEGVANAAVFCVDDDSDGAAAPGDCDADCTDGSNNCSLRDALAANNANNNAPAIDDIIFNIPGAGPHVIAPAFQLPNMTEPVTVDGYSEPGSSPNTLADGNNSVIKIILDGSMAPASMAEGVNGFEISAGHTTIRGFIIHSFQASQIGSDGTGIIMFNIAGNTDNLIEGNFIGTDGSNDLGNEGPGVAAFLQSTNNNIGGPVPAARNVISGNMRAGISLSSSFNVVQGNFIGTDRTGTLALGNTLQGVVLSGGLAISDNMIGGVNPGEGNLISGNGLHGVGLINLVSGTQIQGNFIGTNITGDMELGNGGQGILFQESVFGMPTGNFVGGTDGITAGGPCTGACNLIAFNVGGISIEGGVGNSILGNSIFSNDSLGIDLENLGVVEPNDETDPDVGSNSLQNFPDLTFASAGGGITIAEGNLNSTPGTLFRLEFFSNEECDSSGNGEGQTFLGSEDVTTDGNGNVNFSIPLAAEGANFLASTATDPDRNTSEFSLCIPIQALPDADGDSVPDLLDNCPNASNSTQEDSDGDDFGDDCDQCEGQDDSADDDGNGVPDCIEAGARVEWRM